MMSLRLEPRPLPERTPQLIVVIIHYYQTKKNASFALSTAMLSYILYNRPLCHLRIA